MRTCSSSARNVVIVIIFVAVKTVLELELMRHSQVMKKWRHVEESAQNKVENNLEPNAQLSDIVGERVCRFLLKKCPFYCTCATFSLLLPVLGSWCQAQWLVVLFGVSGQTAVTGGGLFGSSVGRLGNVNQNKTFHRDSDLGNAVVPTNRTTQLILIIINLIAFICLIAVVPLLL